MVLFQFSLPRKVSSMTLKRACIAFLPYLAHFVLSNKIFLKDVLVHFTGPSELT